MTIHQLLWTIVCYAWLAACGTPQTTTSHDSTSNAYHPLRSHRHLQQLDTPATLATPRFLPTGSTGTADNLRTGWYPNQPALTPQRVARNDFGQLFQLQVDGAIYAQPLIFDSILLIATETNHVYGFDAETGAQLWKRYVGLPWDPTPIGCGDLVPHVGITGTPVIDSNSRTVYLLAKTYDETQTPVWYAHGFAIDTGLNAPNFPVKISGNAHNDPSVAFNALVQLQRPALLLMDDVIYAGFGGHCDFGTYYGLIVGVGTDGTLRTMYSAAIGNSHGAGIWQSGGGLVSDQPGHILFTTGNGYNTNLGESPIVGATPPVNLAQSVVRVVVQPDGHLQAVDFFMPADAAALDTYDADLGSGSPVALPYPAFGTPTNPNLLVQVGKGGRLLLLDRDNLGGFRTGPNLGDNVISELSINGGFWGRPSVWSAQGGLIYLVPNGGPLQAYAYSQDGQGRPNLVPAGASMELFGYTTGSPIITSTDNAAETGLVWLIGTRAADGTGGVLRAYDAIADAEGKLNLRFSAAIGIAAKFAPPGVGKGRIYVGTREGKVFCFGAPIPSPLNITAKAFPPTIVQTTSPQSITIQANEPVVIESLVLESKDFSFKSQPTLPIQLASEQVLCLEILLNPQVPGPISAALVLGTNRGVVNYTLSGSGVATKPLLVTSQPALSFAGTTLGQINRQTVTLTNVGAQAYNFTDMALPNSNFTVSGLPALGTSLAPQASVSLTVTFQPQVRGSYVSELVFGEEEDETVIGLTGTADTSGTLVITPPQLDFGFVGLGQTRRQSFTLSNQGNSALLIQRSKPPSKGTFRAASPLDEGTVIAPGQSIVLEVLYQPNQPIDDFDQWSLNTNDGQGARQVIFRGKGAR